MSFTGQVASKPLPASCEGLGARQKEPQPVLWGQASFLTQLSLSSELFFSASLLQMGPVSLFHPLKATLEQTQPAVLRGARVFLRQKSSASLSNGGAM